MVAKKPLETKALRHVRRIRPQDSCATESGFVNHTVVSVPNQFVFGVFQGPPPRRR